MQSKNLKEKHKNTFSNQDQENMARTITRITRQKNDFEKSFSKTKL